MVNDPVNACDLRAFQLYVWQEMEKKGFHDGRTGSGRDDTLVRLCLIHSEVSEAAQEVKRHGVTAETRGKIGMELADILIRLLDLSENLGINLGSYAEEKMRLNVARPHKYGTPEEATNTA